MVGLYDEVNVVGLDGVLRESHAEAIPGHLEGGSYDPHRFS